MIFIIIFINTTTKLKSFIIIITLFNCIIQFIILRIFFIIYDKYFQGLFIILTLYLQIHLQLHPHFHPRQLNLPL